MRLRIAFLAAMLGGLIFLPAWAEPGYVPFEDYADARTLTKLPARKGDGAPDLELRDVVSSRTVRLSDFRGTVVYLDFWATWCPTCPSLLGDLNALAVKHKEDWKGKVTLASISLDQNRTAARDMVEGNGWLAVRHLWSGPDKSGRETLAGKAFGIVELPYAVLLDTSGTVVWRGNPARISAEEEIGKHLPIPRPQ